MIDIKRIREKTVELQEELRKRDPDLDLYLIVDLDKKNRNLIYRLDELKKHKKKLSENLYKKTLKDDQANAEKTLSELNREIKELTPQHLSIQKELNNCLLALPNIPDKEVPVGGKENNVLIRREMTKPQFSFTPKSHYELSEDLGLIDFKRGVKLSGNGAWVYRAMGARLEWALLNLFIDFHSRKGYEFILPPHMMNYENGMVAGQFPKFHEEVYFLNTAEGSEKGKFLLPTAETALVNLYRDEILDSSELPLKLCAYTPCYRVEAGSYRSSERGTLRGHQFNKVELFQFTRPEDSGQALDEMIHQAEALLQMLELHYQVSELAAGDCAFAMARTIDLEVWIPSIKEYKEVSSASIARDFQARRGNIRYRNRETGKPDFVHTLNASGLATSRLVPAILEQFQQKDGSVRIPKALQAYLGTDIIKRD